MHCILSYLHGKAGWQVSRKVKRAREKDAVCAEKRKERDYMAKERSAGAGHLLSACTQAGGDRSCCCFSYSC